MLPLQLKGWIPPRIIALAGRMRHGRSGLGEPMQSWEDARGNSNSYDADIILQRVRDAAKRARLNDDGRTIERDGAVLVDQEAPLALVSCLLRTAARAKTGLTVIDFGGSLGSSYWQCAELLSVVGALRWHVVEQRGFVTCGRAEFETENLRFFEFEEAAAVSHPDVVLFSSVLQYVDDPYDVLMRAVMLKPAAIVIDRTPIGNSRDDAFTIQYVPDDIYPVRLPFRIFGADQFAGRLKSQYRKITEFAALDPDMTAGSLPVRFRGYLFEKTT